MKMNTLMDYPHRGTLVKFTTRTDPATQALFRNYYKDIALEFKLFPGAPSSGRPVVYTNVRLETFQRITDIVDPAGVSILGSENAYGYEINMVVPVINVFGFAEGFSYSLTRLTFDPLTMTIEEPKK